MGGSEPESPDKWQKRFDDYKEKLFQSAVLTLPTAIVVTLLDRVKAKILNQPWEAIWVLVPLAVVVYVLGRRLAGRERLRPDNRLLVFLSAYILLFVFAAHAEFLDLSRQLTVFSAPASRRWLTPVSWGDWRYHLVPRKLDPGDELVVVLLKPSAGRTLADARKELADLIALSSQNGARGVALDVYFMETSPIDPLLCHSITTAGIPVVVGYGFEQTKGHISEIPPPASLQPCLTSERQAHLAGLLDFDLVSRMTPMFFLNNRSRPALGLAVARALSGSDPVHVPPDGLLRFIPPARDPLTLSFEELQKDRSHRNLLRNRFVLAGETSARDSFTTAYGVRPGIVIHSYVTHSLRRGHYIRPQSWWLGFGIIVAFCYWITLACANGMPARRIFLLCAGSTVVIVAIAVACILIGPLWFDIVYPLTAIWLLLPFMLALRNTIAARTPRAAAGTPEAI